LEAALAQINKSTGHRVKYVKVDADTGEEVASDDIVKGYKVDTDTCRRLRHRRPRPSAGRRSGDELRQRALRALSADAVHSRTSYSTQRPRDHSPRTAIGANGQAN